MFRIRLFHRLSPITRVLSSQRGAPACWLRAACLICQPLSQRTSNPALRSSEHVAADGKALQCHGGARMPLGAVPSDIKWDRSPPHLKEKLRRAVFPALRSEVAQRGGKDTPSQPCNRLTKTPLPSMLHTLSERRTEENRKVPLDYVRILKPTYQHLSQQIYRLTCIVYVSQGFVCTLKTMICTVVTLLAVRHQVG